VSVAEEGREVEAEPHIKALARIFKPKAEGLKPKSAGEKKSAKGS